MLTSNILQASHKYELVDPEVIPETELEPSKSEIIQITFTECRQAL